MEPTYLTRQSVDKIIAPLEPAASNIGNGSFAAYASDVLSITPNLMVMASLRADYFNSKGEKSTEEDDFDQWACLPGWVWYTRSSATVFRFSVII